MQRRNLINTARKRLALDIIVNAFGGGILAIVFIYITKLANPGSDWSNLTFDALSIGAPALGAFWRIFSKAIPKYKDSRSSASKRAEEFVREST
jgi:hypothetical protein